MIGLHVELETVHAVTEVGTTGSGGLRLTLGRAFKGPRPSNARLIHYVCPSILPSIYHQQDLYQEPARHARQPSKPLDIQGEGPASRSLSFDCRACPIR